MSGEYLEPIEHTPELTEEDYNDYLDDCFGTVKIAGLEYLTSRALKELDPIAYDCGFSDWEDSRGAEDTMYECPICGNKCPDHDEAKFCCQELESTDA
jgi:hypothetical protein